MYKYLLLFIIVLWQPAFGHDIATKKFDSGQYKENPFEHPSSLTHDEIEIILKEIDRVSGNPILYIKQNQVHMYSVYTCADGNEIVEECKSGEVFIFGHGKVEFVNFSITAEKVQFAQPKDDNDVPIKSLEYSNGKYENVPFNYPDSLSEEQIELLVNKILDQTEYEIFSVYPSRDNFSTYNVMTCTAGARIKYLCDAGESFQFDFDTYKAKNIGNWIQ